MSSPAEVYERTFVPAVFAPCARELLGALGVRPGQRIVDVACGTGAVARAATLGVGPRGQVIAIDLRAGMLAHAAALPAPVGARIAWLRGDALALPLADGCVDAIACQQGLQFFPDRFGAARELRRVLVPGGRVGVAVWQGLERHPFWRALIAAECRELAARGLPSDDAATAFSFGDPNALGALLEGAGFGAVKVEVRTFIARFAWSSGLIADFEHGYAAVDPAFAQAGGGFDSFVAAVAEQMRRVVDAHRLGDDVVVPMHVNLAIAEV